MMAFSVVNSQAIAALIDHTLLKPEATAKDIRRICKEALAHSFAVVCVNPYWIPMVAKLLKGSNVKTCGVVGFPLGATTTEAKVFETKTAIAAGATEIDMVINVGEMIAGHKAEVRSDIAAVIAAAHRKGAIVKVILETALLTDAQKKSACRLAVAAGTDFVKTSTGFGPGGATVEDVSLMRRIVGKSVGVKASGGIRTLADLERMVAAGASRVGASDSIKIIAEADSAAR